MIRAAAKNHAFVAVCTAPEDLAEAVDAITAEGGTRLALRARLAARAFARTAAYDGAIADWFARQEGGEWPSRKTIAGSLKQAMRYGENPHQAAALYVSGESRAGVAGARQMQGKALGYNNINDTDAAVELAAEFDPSATRRRWPSSSTPTPAASPAGPDLQKAAYHLQRPAMRSGVGLWRHRRRQPPA